MMRWKMGKMTHEFGIITLTDSRQFEFEGPQKDFMERWMAELREQRGLSGEPALDAFIRDFSPDRIGSRKLLIRALNSA